MTDDQFRYAIFFRNNQPVRYARGTPGTHPDHPGWVVFTDDNGRKETLAPEADVACIVTVECHKPPVIDQPQGIPAERRVKTIRNQQHGFGPVEIEFEDGSRYHYRIDLTAPAYFGDSITITPVGPVEESVPVRHGAY